MRTAPLFLTLALILILGPGCRRSQPRPEKRPADPQAAATAEAPAAEAPPISGKAAALLGDQGTALSDVAERAVKSVVNISSKKIIKGKSSSSPWSASPWRRWFGRQRPARPRYAQSRGSGVIVSADGIVLTNNHVVQGAQEIKAVLSDGTSLAAELVGSDEKSEVAVLRLKLTQDLRLQPMPMGDSSRLRLGQLVLAIGNPFGVGQTVTMGIVSAVGRGNMGIVDYEDFIQTDAAINPGNSGGALVDLAGRLVGINTAIISRSGGYQGIGFAIPSRMAKPIMDSMIKHGRVVRGWLGVQIKNLDADTARMLGIPGTRGVLVQEAMAGGPAAGAGLQKGDIIVSLDGEKIEKVTRLRTRVAAGLPGSRVVVGVLRRERKLDLTVTLAELGGPPVASLDGDAEALAGLTVETLNSKQRKALGLPAKAQGVLVTRVELGSPAATAGVQEKDLIVEVNRQPVRTAAGFSKRYSSATGKVNLLIFRDGSAMYLLVEK